MAPQAYTVRQALDDANPNRVANALNIYDLGSSLRRIKATITGLTAAAAFDITAIVAARIVINEGPQPVRLSGILPPIAALQTLRVTAGGTAGDYTLTDSGGTAVTTTATYAGRARLSDDGKTLTFIEATITAFVISYYARPGSTLGTTWSAPDMDTQIWSGQPDGIGA